LPDLGCAFRFVFRFLTGLIFGIRGILLITSDSAEHTLELNNSRARLICFGILVRRNPEFRPEFQREGPVTSATIWYHITILLQFATPFNVACGAWSAITVVAIRHPRHPQPVDAETERQGRIRNIEFKELMYTQLAVINNQRLRDFDTVVLKNGPHIRKSRSAECMACIWEAKIFRYSGNPGIRGGFTMQNPVFITWLHLSMLIDIHTPLIIPNQVPVETRYGEIINLDLRSICCPNNCNL
jgi:hypothetical protein